MGETRKAYRIFTINPLEKKSKNKVLSRRLNDTIEMNIDSEDGKWMKLDQERVLRMSFALLNLRILPS
jgi:hypothetical protein